MSHFAVLVTKTQEQDIESQLERFNEDIEVEEYDRDCYCIGSIARRDAGSRAETELNFDLDDVRKAYWSLPEDEQIDKRWNELTSAVNQLTERYEQEHPDYKRPNPNCDSCNGTGIYKSQYNPDSKWDWYCVGGRWMGALQLKNGAEGKLGDSGVFGNTAPEQTADIARVKDVDWDKTESTFSILHKDRWIQRGQMCMFGMASNEKPEDDWDKEFKRVIESLDPEDEVTVVDCHI